MAAILTAGRRTVANRLRTLRHLAPGHPTDYCRVLSRAPWSGLQLSALLTRFLLDHLVPTGPVMLVGDDTVDGHPGAKVYGHARHRDPVRSSHSYTAWRYGHKWVVLVVLVPLPWATRPWALPILVDLDRSPVLDANEQRRHRTPAQCMARLLRVSIRQFPDRVGRYGGGQRSVATLDGTGHWYKAGQELVPIRWVFVRDLTGTHRDEYSFTTDLTFTVEAVIAAYCGRWNIETTFQEARSCLGLETTRGWCRKTVLRAAPCLFGLYSVVAILFHALPESKRTGAIVWPGKTGVTFSDALCAVRRWLWAETILPQAGDSTALDKLSASVRELLLTTLAPAA